MNECYYPSRELSIDEFMVLWRGRLRFRQYIKGKRHKFGIKLYVLCEPKGIALKIIIQGLSELADQNNTVKSSSSGNNWKNIFLNPSSLDFKIRTFLINQSRVDIKLP
jgi:hypothetical protein